MAVTILLALVSIIFRTIQIPLVTTINTCKSGGVFKVIIVFAINTIVNTNGIYGPTSIILFFLAYIKYSKYGTLVKIQWYNMSAQI